MINEQDDDGILAGNWSGDYSGGTSPLKWTGSGEILAEFNKTKSPVLWPVLGILWCADLMCVS